MVHTGRQWFDFLDAHVTGSFPSAGSKEQFKEICGLLLWRDRIFINVFRHGHGLKPSHSEPWELCFVSSLGQI